MRCFIACFLDPESAQRVDQLIPDLAEARRVPPQNLHMTLLFLGQVPVERTAAVIELAAVLPARPVAATIATVTGFPEPRRARVLVATLEQDPCFLEWHLELQQRWPVPGREFKPHLTLARDRDRLIVPAIPQLEGLVVGLMPPAAYVSETPPEGAHYRPLV